MGAFDAVTIGSGDVVSPRQHPPVAFEQQGFGFGVFLASRQAGHQDVPGFEIAVHDRLLMRVLHPFANFDEQLEPFANPELLAVAVVGDGLPGDILHDEVRLAIGRRSGVEHLGDAGMVHDRERLPLGIKALQHGIVVTSDPDKFERNLTVNRLLSRPASQTYTMPPSPSVRMS